MRLQDLITEILWWLLILLAQPLIYIMKRCSGRRTGQTAAKRARSSETDSMSSQAKRARFDTVLLVSPDGSEKDEESDNEGGQDTSQSCQSTSQASSCEECDQWSARSAAENMFCDPFCPRSMKQQFGWADDPAHGCWQLGDWGTDRLIDDPVREFLINPLSDRKDRDSRWEWQSFKGTALEQEIIAKSTKAYVARGVKTIANLTNLLYKCIPQCIESSNDKCLPELRKMCELQLDLTRKVMRMLYEKMTEPTLTTDSGQKKNMCIYRDDTLDDLTLRPLVLQYLMSEVLLEQAFHHKDWASRVEWKPKMNRGCWQPMLKTTETTETTETETKEDSETGSDNESESDVTSQSDSEYEPIRLDRTDGEELNDMKYALIAQYDVCHFSQYEVDRLDEAKAEANQPTAESGRDSAANPAGSGRSSPAQSYRVGDVSPAGDTAEEAGSAGSVNTSPASSDKIPTESCQSHENNVEDVIKACIEDLFGADQSSWGQETMSSLNRRSSDRRLRMSSDQSCQNQEAITDNNLDSTVSQSGPISEKGETEPQEESSEIDYMDTGAAPVLIQTDECDIHTVDNDGHITVRHQGNEFIIKYSPSSAKEIVKQILKKGMRAVRLDNQQPVNHSLYGVKPINTDTKAGTEANKATEPAGDQQTKPVAMYTEVGLLNTDTDKVTEPTGDQKIRLMRQQQTNKKLKDWEESVKLANEEIEFQNEKIKQAFTYHTDEQVDKEVAKWYRMKPKYETMAYIQEAIKRDTEKLKHQAWVMQDLTSSISVNKAKNQYLEQKVKTEFAKNTLAIKKFEEQKNRLLNNLEAKLGFKPSTLLCTAKCDLKMLEPIRHSTGTNYQYQCAMTPEQHDHKSKYVDPVCRKHWHTRPAVEDLREQIEFIHSHVQYPDIELDSGEYPEYDRVKADKVYEAYKQHFGTDNEKKYESFWKNSLVGKSTDLNSNHIFRETKHIETEFDPILRRFLFKQYAHVIFNHSNICIPAGSKPWRQRNEMEFGDITASTEKLIEEIAEVVGWPKDQLVLAYKILTQQALMEQLENMSNCDYCTNIYPCSPHVNIRKSLDKIFKLKGRWRDQDYMISKTIPTRKFPRAFHGYLDRMTPVLQGRYKECKVKHQAHMEYMNYMKYMEVDQYKSWSHMTKQMYKEEDKIICNYFGCANKRMPESELIIATYDPTRVIGIRWLSKDSQNNNKRMERYFNKGHPEPIRQQTSLVMGVDKKGNLTYTGKTAASYLEAKLKQLTTTDNIDRSYIDKVTSSTLDELTKPDPTRYDIRIGGEWRVNQGEGVHNPVVANALTARDYPFKIHTDTERLMDLGHINKRKRNSDRHRSCSDSD